MASEATDNYAPKHHSVDDNGDIEMALSTVEKDRGVEQEHSSAVPTVVVFSEMPKTDVETEMGVISETLKTETSADRVTEISGCDTGEMPNQEHSINLEHVDSGFPDWMHFDLPVSEIPPRPIKYGPEGPPKSTKHEKGGSHSAQNTTKEVDALELVRIAKLPNSRTRAERVHAIRHHAGRLQLKPKDYEDLQFTCLHQVAWGDEDQFTLLENPEPSGLNALAIGGLTPLHVAAFRGQTKVVEILLSQEEIHLDAKTTSIQVMTRVDMDLPTSETSTNSGSEVYRRKGDANSSTEDGKMELWAGLTALHLAADGDHPEVVKLLLEAARNKGDRFLRHFVNAKDGVLGRTALHFACRNGSDAVVKELLQCKDMDGEMVVDWKAKDSYWGNENGYTPFLLTAAAEGDHYKVMRLFFSNEILSGEDMIEQVEEISMKDNFQKMQDEMDWRLILTFPKLVDSYYTDVFQPQCFSSELLRGEPEEFQTMQSTKFSAMRLAIRGNNAKVLQRCLIGKLLKQKPNIWRAQSFGSARNLKKESLIREFLHYAARIGSYQVVRVLLYVDLSDLEPEQARKKYAGRANSMRNGSTAVQVAVQRFSVYAHAQVNEDDESYNLKLWEHITEVVNIIAGVKGFHSSKRDSQDRTIFYHFCECATVMPPMERKLKKQRTMMIKNVTQKFVVNSEDIRNTCTLYENEKLKLQNACNAILVGATLVAGLAYNGLLQPPRPSTPGINYYENLFWTFNSLAFYFTIYTIICCLEVIIPQRKLFIPGLSEYVEDEIENLRVRVTFASFWFTLSTTLAIGAYITGEFLMAQSKRLVLTSTIFGLVYLIPLIAIFLGRDYARLARDLFDEYHWFNILFHKPFFIDSLIQHIRDSLGPSLKSFLGFTKNNSESIPSPEGNRVSADDGKQKDDCSNTPQFSMIQWKKYKQKYAIISNVVVSHFVVIGAVFVFWISVFSHPSSTL